MPCKKLPHTHDILKSERGTTAGPWLPVGLWWLWPLGGSGDEWARLRYLPGHSKGRRREVCAVESRHWAQLQKDQTRKRKQRKTKEEGKEERNLEVERDRERVK